MAIEKLNPYLIFRGDAEQAIALYRSALDAGVEQLMRWSEGPGCPDGGKAPNPELVMHASLTIGGGTLMLADEPESAPGRPTGSSTVCLHFDDLADMAQRFEALSTGGKITMPLQETFWKATFGMLTDAFGVSWMFQCPKTA